RSKPDLPTYVSTIVSPLHVFILTIYNSGSIIERLLLPSPTTFRDLNRSASSRVQHLVPRSEGIRIRPAHVDLSPESIVGIECIVQSDAAVIASFFIKLTYLPLRFRN